MIRALDTVILTRDLPEHGLHRGDVGAVVHAGADGAACVVEFVALDGATVALVPLGPADLRPAGPGEVACARRR
jgi:hypothetical protein